MNFLKPQNFLVPLALLSIVAPGVSFLEPLFGGIGRWVLLALLATYVMLAGHTVRMVNPKVAAALIGYIAWCICTYSWSDVPELTGMKLIALVLVVLASLLGGYHWVAHHELRQGIDYLWPYAAVSLIAGIWDRTPEAAPYESAGVAVYQGATGNPNLLGVMIATSTAIVVWRLYMSWSKVRARTLWFVVLAAYLVVLYLTASRASYLVFAGVLSGLLIALGMRRVALASVVTAVAMTLFLLLAPELTDDAVQRNVYKYSPDGTLLYSREENLTESYGAALTGGSAGIGYGVSVGESDFDGGFTAVGYGREKGNSQLAIVEETGVVGLLLYAVLIGAIFVELIRCFSRARGEAKILLGIVIGTLGGMLLQSAFEAWWVAPGSPEFGFFWMMVGTALGMGRAAVRLGAADLSESVPMQPWTLKA
jgi:hypothetical protein